jgi:hypothetical protein
VDELESAIADVRDLFDALLASARERLVAGAPLNRIHEAYVTVAFRILEAAEADALLASAGDGTALTRLAQQARELEDLQEALAAEFPP